MGRKQKIVYSILMRVPRKWLSEQRNTYILNLSESATSSLKINSQAGVINIVATLAIL